MDIVDEVIPVENEAAFDKAREVAKSDGLLVGISSGSSNICGNRACEKTREQGKEYRGAAPDTGERYLSTPLLQ